MKRWLLDTNVVSEPRRPRPDANVLNFLGRHEPTSYFVSTITFAELRFGIDSLRDPITRAELGDWLDRTVRPIFRGRVLDVTEDVLLRWRILMEEGRKMGRTFSQPDLILAATAALHGLTIVTRDTRGFDQTGVAVLNPWREVAS